MLEEDRYCVDILTQTRAVRSALKAVESLTLKDHARCCVDDVMEREGPTAQREKLQFLSR
ncbi:MAG: metal-sensitive transcriptional regulator [Devosia sp.]